MGKNNTGASMDWGVSAAVLGWPGWFSDTAGVGAVSIVGFTPIRRAMIC
jgi:hypothetical protein